MRTLLSVAFALIAVPALAADLPVRVDRATARPVSWAGLYVGANLGYGWGRADVTDTLAAPGLGAFSTSFATEGLKGAIGGAQLGYNWQLDRFVLGLEADLGFSGQRFSGSHVCVIAGATAPGCSINASDRIRWLGTLRGRLGFSFDRFLLYVTAGAAWQSLESEGGVTVTGAGNFALIDSTTIKGGYTIGGGMEVALREHWTAGVEYLYIDTGTRNVAQMTLPAALGGMLGAPAGTTLAETIRLTDNLIRLRVNYRF
jgi:outer membrane immunogenic protein